MNTVTIAAVEFIRRKNSKAFMRVIVACRPNAQEAPIVEATKIIA